MSKVQTERLTLQCTLVKVFAREFEGRQFYKARVLDLGGEVYDLNVQESLVKEKPDILNWVNKQVMCSLAITSGQYNRATPILVDVV